MRARPFSAGEAIRFGWSAMTKNLGFFVVMQLIIFGINIVPSQLGGMSQMAARIHPHGFSLPLALKVGLYAQAFALRVAGAFFSMVVTMGAMRVFLDVHDGREPAFADLFSCMRLFFKYLLLSLLNILIAMAVIIPAAAFVALAVAYRAETANLVIAGSAAALFILAATAYVGLRVWAAPWCIVDRSAGPVESLKTSWRITRGAAWPLLGFFALVCLVEIAGLLCCCIGTFATSPTASVATAYVYRKLIGAGDAGAARAPVPGAAPA